MKEELVTVTLRLRKGDKEALALYFAPVKYNKAIRSLVSKVVDNIRARGEASVELKPSDIDI